MTHSFGWLIANYACIDNCVYADTFGVFMSLYSRNYLHTFITIICMFLSYSLITTHLGSRDLAIFVYLILNIVAKVFFIKAIHHIAE